MLYKLGLVVQTYNPSRHLGGRLNSRPLADCLACSILATQETEIRRMGFKASLGKEYLRSYLEKTHHKRGLVEGSR
jgi:hypothetical protein